MVTKSSFFGEISLSYRVYGKQKGKLTVLLWH